MLHVASLREARYAYPKSNGEKRLLKRLRLRYEDNIKMCESVDFIELLIQGLMQRCLENNNKSSNFIER